MREREREREGEIEGEGEREVSATASSLVSHVRAIALQVPNMQMIADTSVHPSVHIQMPQGHCSNPFDQYYDDWLADYSHNEYRAVQDES